MSGAAPPFSVEYLEGPLVEPMPDEFSPSSVRRAIVLLAAVIVVVAVVVAMLPGLGSLREAFSGARPELLALAAVLEVGSCLSYVLAFRGVFCQRMRRLTSYEIGTAELAANSLLSVGGAGGLALGAWILRRGGVPASQIARRTVAFFLITSCANVLALIVAGIGLGTGVLHGAPSAAYGFIPAGVAVAGIVLVLFARGGAKRIARRSERERLVRALDSLADGVDEALALLRSRERTIVLGAAGYVLFDVAMLGVCFEAFGLHSPPGGVLLVAYLVGQLGGLIPLPGGIGGVDGGLIGTLVVFGVDATDAAVAVLAYRALVLWLPVMLGVPSLASLRRRLRSEEHDIAACAPGDEVEVLGRGRVVADSLQT
ncbi:MAG: putative heme transporter [Thermoleophilaceae bacterium]|nr:putative heme transporter [Thermoleophilaceae bacterium]